MKPQKKYVDHKLHLYRAVAYTVMFLLSFLCLFFFYILIDNATHNNFDIQKGFQLLPGGSFLTNLKNTMNDANVPVLSGLRNSLIVAGCSAALSCYFSALTAYAIYAKNAAFTIILLIMTMPMQVSALGFLRLMDNMHLTNTLWPLILPSIVAPTVFFFMKQYMDSSLPKELIEAARIDGSGEFHTFNVIILPILKPAVAVQAIFSFVGSWNNYFTPALIISDAKWKTVPILIAQLRGADFLKFDMGKVYMMIALAILPVIIVYLILSKYIVRGIALGSVKRQKERRNTRCHFRKISSGARQPQPIRSRAQCRRMVGDCPSGIPSAIRRAKQGTVIQGTSPATATTAGQRILHC